MTRQQKLTFEEETTNGADTEHEALEGWCPDTGRMERHWLYTDKTWWQHLKWLEVKTGVTDAWTTKHKPHKNNEINVMHLFIHKVHYLALCTDPAIVIYYKVLTDLCINVSVY